MATFVQEFGKGATTGLAEKVYKAFRPSDLVHVGFMLGIKKMKGFTHQIAYDLASRFPDYAKVIIARSKR